jgi:hypothetical protein
MSQVFIGMAAVWMPSIGLVADARTRAVESLSRTPAPELMQRMTELQSAAVAAGLTPDEVGAVLNARDDLPRPLLDEERATLLAVLNHAAFSGRDELLAQVDATRVVRYCGCGCASVGLAVERSAPAAEPPTSPLPNDAQVLGPDREPIGGVLVFVEEGYLALLEVYGYEDRISPFPSLERLDFTPLPTRAD